MAAPDGVACRLMRPQDWPALLALWQQVFGDTPRYASHCIDTFAGTDNVLVAQRADGVAIAMLLAVPCRLEGQGGVYLYALATRPEYRGRGVMAALMEESDHLAFLRGAAFSVLIPASLPLYGYYRGHGYAETLALRHLSLDAAPQPPGGTAPFAAEILSPTGEGLARLRRRWLGVPAVTFGGARADMAARDLADAGAFAAESGGGYAVCLARDGVLLAAELAADGDGAADALLAFAMGQTGCQTARLTLPAASPLFAGRGSRRPAALLKVLDGAFCPDPAAYLRFAMDEPFQFDPPAG